MEVERKSERMGISNSIIEQTRESKSIVEKEMEILRSTKNLFAKKFLSISFLNIQPARFQRERGCCALLSNGFTIGDWS